MSRIVLVGIHVQDSDTDWMDIVPEIGKRISEGALQSLIVVDGDTDQLPEDW